jgi:nucleoside-triphosphatase THEP1
MEATRKQMQKKLQKVLTSENPVLLWLHQLRQHKETQDDQLPSNGTTHKQGGHVGIIG